MSSRWCWWNWIELGLGSAHAMEGFVLPDTGALIEMTDPVRPGDLCDAEGAIATPVPPELSPEWREMDRTRGRGALKPHSKEDSTRDGGNATT
ncbi:MULTISPECIES: hypothetical protein [Streptomyces]|uniref:hypothetical protein n=1 Tax=Streptomyces TaxID=1883 RepID=UPI0014049B13|nr:hypothetical protein [Streptomyces sp. BK205]